LHQLGDGFYLRYVHSIHSVSICKIENNAIYTIESSARHKIKFFHRIIENQFEISKDHIFKGEQTVYKLSEAEMYLVLVDFY